MKKPTLPFSFFALLLVMCSGSILMTYAANRSNVAIEETDIDDEEEEEDDEDPFADRQAPEHATSQNEEAELRRRALAHRLSVMVRPADNLPELRRRAEQNALDLLTLVKADASREEIAAVRQRVAALGGTDSAMLQEVCARYGEQLATTADVLLTEAAYLQICIQGAERQFAGLGSAARPILVNLRDNLEMQAESRENTAAERAMAQDKLTHWFPQDWRENWFPAPTSSDPLAVDIFRRLAEQTEGNVLFSPATLESALRLLRVGSGGATRAELDALPYGGAPPYSANTPGASAIFLAEEAPLHSDFTPPAGHENSVRSLPLRTRPEEAAQAINRWCRENTGGMIPTVITPADISPHVSMLAVSALYFKRDWLQPFDEEYTKEMDFHLADGTTVRVPMMRRSPLALTYARGEDWEAVAVPYTGGLYFIGILPSGNVRDFARALTHDKLHAIRTQLAGKDPEEVELILPRFTCHSGELNLEPVLKALGLHTAFDPATADFTGFTEGKLFLSALVQQNVIEFTEKGTTGASITLAESDEGELAELLFNRPFLWIIADLDSDAAPLFMGLTEKP